MESRVEKLEESITNLKKESSLLKNEILNLKTLAESLNKTSQDFNNRFAHLEEREKYSKIQNKLTNAPKIDVKHDHKDWITTICLVSGRHLLTGSKDCSIKCITIGEDEENPILFTITKAHDRAINYILKIKNGEIISTGDV